MPEGYDETDFDDRQQPTESTVKEDDNSSIIAEEAVEAKAEETDVVEEKSTESAK